MKRRELLKGAGAAAILSATSQHGIAAAKRSQAISSMKSYVYKQAAHCEIRADVHGGGTPGEKKPVVVNIHGGALIMGSRTSIRRELFDPLLAEGFVVVSIDYRLAPETKLPGIIEDVRDAFRWVRERGPALFGADPDRIGVHGESAGGYLALMAGFCVEPRPRALVAYYGYGNIIGDWYARPDPFYARQPRVSEATARAAVAGEPVCEQPTGTRRDQFYLYCRQNGLWPKEVVGIDPHEKPEAFVPYCPVKNITPDYPPTLLCHGTRDNDVPYAQSVEMAAEFARVGVPYEFLPLQRADHGFAGADTTQLRSAIERSVGFFLHYVRGTRPSP